MLGVVSHEFSEPDQVKRHAQHKTDDVARVLRIDDVFPTSAAREYYSTKRVVVTGAARGLGLSLTTQLVEWGASIIATVRKSSEELDTLATSPDARIQIVPGVDMTDDGVKDILRAAITEPVDVVIHNAGYFAKHRSTLLSPESKDADGDIDFADELRTIDICAIGPLRVTHALMPLIRKPGGHVVFITSQGGSVEWRAVQSPEGGDFGHHASKAAANMIGVLVANEVKPLGIKTSVLHPGFNRTGMTAKYAAIWDAEGAVEPIVGAKRVLYQISLETLEGTPTLFNCEDGMPIPW